MCGTNIMRCVVVGNSPDVEELGEVVDEHDVVIRTGRVALDGVETLVGSRTDMLVTRTNKFDHNHEFGFQVNIPEIDKPVPKEIILLSNHELNPLCVNILSDVDQMVKLNNKEKPTLGLIAVVVAIKLYNKVNIHGIETQIHSKYHSHGHLGEPGYRRENAFHSLSKEVLYYNKMIRQGIINKI